MAAYSVLTRKMLLGERLNSHYLTAAIERFLHFSACYMAAAIWRFQD